MAKAAPDELGVDPLIAEALKQNVTQWQENTYDSRSGELRRFDQWCEENGYDLLELGPQKVQEFITHLDDQGYAPGTIESYFEAIRVLYNELSGILDKREDHPVEDLLEYKKKSKIIPSSNGAKKHDELEYSYLDKDEVLTVADNVPAPRVRNELLVKLMFQTGIRASEASEIRLDNIDRDTNTIRIRNKKKDNPTPEERYRTVIYHPDRNGVGALMRLWLDSGRRDALSKYAAESDRLFISERAPELPVDRITRIVRRAAENAGMQEVMYQDQRGRDRYKITAHTLRHSHAVYALKSGIDVRTLQEHMGHESIDITEKYLRIVSDDVEEKFKRRWGVTEQ